ncbi:MAG: FAD-dependent oxidoreductase [Thauera sp.]|jgi:monoamine oxidase|nr:FAD-dependent oxidoreductase [Thauera sp.]
MQTARVVIVGGGLSGLYAAYLLQQRGFRDHVLLEAREVLGGRIVSVPASVPGSVLDATAEAANRVDLGPSWFWPGYQRQLDHLVDELGLARFEQFENGDMMVERSPRAAPARMRGYASAPPSMRLMGGMAALTNALHHRLDPARIFTGHTVRALRVTEAQVELESVDASGRLTNWRAAHVLLALPPRLVDARIAFSPALPEGLSRQWHATPTWMAPHAKYLAIYDAPFWREQGLSGEARSACGPLGEIHDASIPGGSAALFGFFGVPATARKGVPEAELRGLCRAQLVRLFGPLAATHSMDFIQDWALEPYTATTADLDSAGQHVEAPPSMAASGPWCGRLTGIASEWSPQFPGYVAGAVEAASLAVQMLTEKQ